MGAKIAYDLDLFNILNRSEYPQSTSALAQITGAEEELLSIYVLLDFLSSESNKKNSTVAQILGFYVNDWWSWSRPLGTFKTNWDIHSPYDCCRDCPPVRTPFIEPPLAELTRYSTDNLGTGILALPGYLRRHNYRSPSNITDTAFTDANPSAPHIFEWMGKNTENLRTFMLWMGAHRLRDKEWLDVFPFHDVVCSGFETGNTPVFVDVGGGIGHQCKVCLPEGFELANSPRRCWQDTQSSRAVFSWKTKQKHLKARFQSQGWKLSL